MLVVEFHLSQENVTGTLYCNCGNIYFQQCLGMSRLKEFLRKSKINFCIALFS